MHTSAHTVSFPGANLSCPLWQSLLILISPLYPTGDIFFKSLSAWKDLFALKFLSMSEQVFVWSFMTVMQKRRTVPSMHKKSTNTLP